jgi:saccharopine dehydrogenase-like NADP-dependent oxidoreductase
MKVIILGGHGFIGTTSARELVRYEDVSQVTLADVDARSERLTDTLRQPSLPRCSGAEHPSTNAWTKPPKP